MLFVSLLWIRWRMCAWLIASHVFSRFALAAALVLDLVPSPSAIPLQKVGKGKFAHWPILKHTTVSHEITVALAVDRFPDGTRVKIKYIDESADCPAASTGDNVPEHIYRKQLENGKFVNTIGFVLLESRSNGSNFIGMMINEEYRGRGLAKVLVSIWAALCLMAGVPIRTGIIDKPVIAHIFESLGFIAPHGASVRLTNAKRFKDCTMADATFPHGAGLSYQKQNVKEIVSDDSETHGENRTNLQTRTVRVHAEFQPPDENVLRRLVAEVLSGNEGKLDIAISKEQIQAALGGRWRQDGKVVI